MPAVRLLYAGAGDAVAIYQRTDGTEGLLDGSGDLTLLQSVPIPGGLRAFTFSPDKYRLHVVTNEDTCTSFKVDQATGELTPAGGEPVSLPISPCYMTTDRTGRYVLLASYIPAKPPAPKCRRRPKPAVGFVVSGEHQGPR